MMIRHLSSRLPDDGTTTWQRGSSMPEDRELRLWLATGKPPGRMGFAETSQFNAILLELR
jgi:hypothetical protein